MRLLIAGVYVGVVLGFIEVGFFCAAIWWFVHTQWQSAIAALLIGLLLDRFNHVYLDYVNERIEKAKQSAIEDLHKTINKDF